MSWRIADTGEVIDINYSSSRPKRLKTTINDDSITIAPNSANESLLKGWRLADEPKPSANYSDFPNSSNSLATPKGWRLAEPPQTTYNTQNQNPFKNDPLQNAVLDSGKEPMPQMGEFDKTKSYTPNDFFWDVAHGVDRGYMKIGAGINKALNKASKKLGANKTADWFEDNYWRNQHLINQDNEEIKNKYVGLGGEIAGDPTIMLPLGILGKTRGFKNTVKSGLAGAAIATPSELLRNYGDESVSNKQMMSNTLINALAGGGINSLLASKTGNVLVNKIANAYRSARGKEKVAYSNFRRGVEIPQAPEQTNSQIFENIKNVYDDIGIDTPLPKANIVPYDKAFARKQAQNSEFIKGDGFRMQRESEPPYQAYTPKEQLNKGEMVSEIKQIPFKSNLLPPQNLKAPITTDDIFKEAINLHRSGFKFGNDMDENLNLVLNKIKNDRLNTTSAKNAQVPNNELLPQLKEPISIKKEPLLQDEFYLNRANKYIDELEQKGLKPEYVAKLRNNALENPHRFSDEAIEKNEWFMKNNHDTLFNKQGKAPSNEPISKSPINTSEMPKVLYEDYIPQPKRFNDAKSEYPALRDDEVRQVAYTYEYDRPFYEKIKNVAKKLSDDRLKKEYLNKELLSPEQSQKLIESQRVRFRNKRLTPKGIIKKLNNEIDKSLAEFNEISTLIKQPHKRMKGGFITPNLAKDMASSGVGAGIGANLDEENRLRGAMLGGLAGLGIRHGVNKGFDTFISSQAKRYQNIAKGNPQLFNKIVKENIKSSVLPTNAYQKVDDLAQKAGAKQNLFAYENSATNIKKDTIKNLNTAKQMQKNGDDELKIWRETGWFKDKDNIWKFELNDSNAKIKTLKQGILGNVLKHDELFKAYPELKNNYVFFDSNIKTNSLFNPKNGEITINANLSKSDIKNALMQEIQNAIQHKEYAGFKNGAKLYDDFGRFERDNVVSRLNLTPKQQSKIINRQNPVNDDYHTWVRSEDDIIDFKKIKEDDFIETPDWTLKDYKKAVNNGEVKVYSSNPITSGNFVTPSKMEAMAYAGNGKVYEKSVNINEVAWIDSLQGQYIQSKSLHPFETAKYDNYSRHLSNESIAKKDALNTYETIKNSPQKGQNMPIIGRENLNAELVEYLVKNKNNVAIEMLDESMAKSLGFKYPNVRRTISSDAVIHTLNRHGINSPLVKNSGQKAVSANDISKWIEYSDNADIRAIAKDKLKQDVIISAKQINGYYVVVESIRKKGNELAFKTMYFQNGNLKNNPAFKGTQTLLHGYEPDANSFVPNRSTIPQNTLNNNKMKGGFTTQAMAKNIVAGGVGGGIGAYSAPEDKKLEGFIIGALGGMGASNFGGISHSAVNLVKNMIKTPKGIDKAIEKGVDKGLVGVANKFLSKEAAKTWSDIGGNVGNIKYFFTNTLDKSYEKVRDSVTGELNAMFNKYVNLSGVLNQLSKKDNKAFYDFLANNGSIENLSPEIRKFANDVRNQIIKEFEYQVGAKLIDENTAKEFSGNFLSRIYENEGLKSKFKDWISSGSSAFGIDPIYKRGLEKTIGIGEYQRLKALNKIAVKGDKGFSTGGKWILNEPYDEKTLLKMADENTKIKIRRDYTADERAKMGEVTDIARVLPQTLYKMASRRINNEFLSKTLDLAKNTDKILAPDGLLPHLKELQKAGNKREIMRLGYMQIPDNDRFGVLKGKFLRRDVAYDISQKIDSFRNKNLGTKIYTDYLNAWKWAKTVGNTTGHFNNFVGNAFLMKLAGIETKELKGMVTNVGVLKDAGKFTELRMKEKLGNIKPNELMWLNENRAKFKNYELASSVGLFGRSRLNDMGIENSFTFKEDGILRKIGKFANNMYGAEDDVARLTMFDALVKKGKTPKEAKEFTNLLMPDYTRYMPPAIRTIKDLGIAPFISWTYYVIPSVFKLAGTKTGLNNIASTFALMFAGSYLMTGVNPFGKDMPDNNKGKYLPVYKKGDTVTSLKIDRVIPYAEWLNPMNFGEAPLEAMGTMATAPIAKAVSDTKNLLLNRKIPINDFTNRPVTYSNKPLGEKTYDISKYMVQQHTPLPATASNVWNFIESLARTQKQRKTNDTFVPRSTTQEIIKLLGPNLSNHSIKGLNADRKRKKRQEKKRAK